MSDRHAMKLYGNDHSPWVQAVMLGLHEEKRSYERSTVPSIEVFRQWGPMMPAAKMGNEPWFLESSAILERLGFAVSEADMAAVRQAWTGSCTELITCHALGRIQLGERPEPVGA